MDREQYFESIYREYYPKVYAYIKRRVMLDQETEDMVQDIFLACYTHLDTFDERRASLGTWMFVIMTNRLKKYYRDKKSHVSIDAEETVQIAEDCFEQSIVLQEMKTIVLRALGRLSERERKVITGKYFQKKKSEEIAQMVHTTSGNVRMIQARALKKLQKILKEAGFEY